jgi:hypothetical protein
MIEELFFRYTVMFHETFFSKGPESFNTVDVHLSLFELVLVVNIEMSASAEHERIIIAPFIGIYDWSASNLFNSLINQGFSFDIREDTE